MCVFMVGVFFLSVLFVFSRLCGSADSLLRKSRKYVLCIYEPSVSVLSKQRARLFNGFRVLRSHVYAR